MARVFGFLGVPTIELDRPGLRRNDATRQRQGKIRAYTTAPLRAIPSTSVASPSISVERSYTHPVHFAIQVKRGPIRASPKANPSTTTLHRTLQSDPATFVFMITL